MNTVKLFSCLGTTHLVKLPLAQAAFNCYYYDVERGVITSAQAVANLDALEVGEAAMNFSEGDTWERIA